MSYSGRAGIISVPGYLSQHKERDVDEAFEISRYWHRTFDLVQYGGLPVVAAMHGAVMGGGLELATSAICPRRGTVNDLPVAGRTPASMSVAVPLRVARIIGPGRMTEMMLTGRRVDAEEGQKIGLSHHLGWQPSTRRWNWQRPLPVTRRWPTR